MKRSVLAVLFLGLAPGLARPAAAQLGGAVRVAPYLGYGFFGRLPGGGPKLNEALAFGARGALRLTPQFALYGDAQRSTPHTGTAVTQAVTVDQWSAGLEFSYVPRGGAEGMLPVLLDAGVGRVRYDFSEVPGMPPLVTDRLVNVGLASALRLGPRLGLRYGVNDRISNFEGGRGVVNHFFVSAGLELRF